MSLKWRTNSEVHTMDEDTHKLPIVSTGSSHNVAFRTYLERHHLSHQRVALASNVRRISVWSIDQGIPVCPDRAVAVRAGLQKLTGVPYTAYIAVVPESIMNMVRLSDPFSAQNL